MKLIFLYILALLYAPVVFGKSAVIRKIYTNREEASAEFLADYNAYPKQHLIARFDNGKNCYLAIKRVHKKLALLDLRYCIYKHFIYEGQTLSRWEEIEEDVDLVSVSKAPEVKIYLKEDFWFDPVEEVERKEKEEKLKVSQGLALSILWSFANKIDTTGTVDTGGRMETRENTTGMFGLGIEYFYSNEGSVGWSAGWTWEMIRKFTDRTVNYNGSISTQPLDDESLWLNMIFANINYTIVWKLYFSAGINLSIPIENGQEISTNPFLGGQLGIGKIMFKRIIVDINYRWVNFTGAGEYDQGFSKWESASFNGAVLSLKYLFD